ncbi:peroxiredoxin [Novosphingobium sp.]|uniref:peroxiredoxin n=1 Tax=Novosphingobium sp. TaxID=1874826 RepID=UPI003B51C805
MTLTIGESLPPITLVSPDGEPVKTSDFAGQKLVLFFYPKDDTPGCTTENKDFSTLSAQFAEAGTALLGISKDPPQKHHRFIEKHGLKAPLATDAETAGLSDALGIWTEKSMYGRTYMGMERTTLLIGADGRIAQIWRKVKVKDHAKEVLAAAKAL